MNDYNDNQYDEDQPDSLSSSSLLSSLRAPPNRHFYLTRRGKILQSTTERYLRDDLGFGSMLVPSSSSSSSDEVRSKKRKKSSETIAGKIVELVPYTVDHVSTLVDLLASTTTSFSGSMLRLVVVDTNVLLHHMDVLEYLRKEDEGDEENPIAAAADEYGACNGRIRHFAIANAIVIPQTALEECRHRSLVMYRRATDLVRSSSSSSSLSTSSASVGGDLGGNRRRQQRRCVIVFADVHHVDTQIKSDLESSAHYVLPPTSAVSYDKNDDETVDVGAITTINDENDARLRKVAWFYGRALHDFYQSVWGVKGMGDQQHQHKESKKQLEVIFLSDDAQSRKLALLEQPRDDEPSDNTSSSSSGTTKNGLYYRARSVREHVTLLQKEDPTLNLLDMVANFSVGSGGRTAMTADERVEGIERGQYSYAPHIASSTLSHGLRTNRYYQGVYRSNRDSYTEGYVTIRRGEDRVAVVVSGREDVNRAVDGDIVAVELFSVDLWLTNTQTLGGRVEANDGGSCATGHSKNQEPSDDEKEKNHMGEQTSFIAADTAEPSLRDIENITEDVPVDEGGQMRRPVGKGK
jgi:hypothetical protein